MKRTFLAIVCAMAMAFTANAQDFAELKNEGNKAMAAKDYTTALDNYKKAIEVMPEEVDATVYFNAGYSCYKNKQYAEAVPFFDQAIENNYKACNSWDLKVASLKKAKKNEEMFAACEKGLESCPKSKTMTKTLSSKYYKEGAAIVKKANTMQADPAKIEQAKEEAKKAVPLLEKALEIDPNNSNAKQLMASVEAMINTPAAE
ncbi:tetratricopeptide repeat protein [Persicobacter sp. CCB-QB2]|uniref:tetratricopeptide repeat protein n=1 Tax=Persicobacter sp. CCB-QB2 TaxID=1561025 RepID=UPI0009E3CD4A|nr:tetratricopeptide repeat protein [Persicobacter sp. CCB-QB2]